MYPGPYAAAALVDRVRQWLGQGVRPSEIAVSARFNTSLSTVHDALVAADVPAVRVRDQPGADADGCAWPPCTP
ncbi:hypothetical protein OG559_29160 [Micromonospora sp. NBC_01405]|uniref:hypothetical protein n=1 Tax=Micromonospora sp. NBC_01405 TaxID=2903589 RepID=UPI00324CCA83